MHCSCFTNPGQLCMRKMQQTYVNHQNADYSLAPSKDLQDKNPKGSTAENLPIVSLTLEPYYQQQLIKKQFTLQQVLFRQR